MKLQIIRQQEIKICRSNEIRLLLELDDRGGFRGHSDIQIRLANMDDRDRVIDLVNSVASEHKYLQTDRYCPTPAWERVLREGINLDEGLLLLVVQCEDQIVGFGRLTPDFEHPLERLAGNVGIVLAPAFRSRGIGGIILKILISGAEVLKFHLLTANILATNSPSLHLFNKFGFAPARCRKIYLPYLANWVNEIILEKKIKS